MRAIGDSVLKPLRSPAPSPAEHPSAPIPVQGPGLGSTIRVRLGETGLSVFPLILGAGEFGWNVDSAVSDEILDAYRARGGNAVHVADGDAGGRSEHIVGHWMRTRGARDDTVVTVRVGGSPDHPGLGSVNLIRAVESTLGRLGTDRIDVLYLDATTDAVTPLEDTLATAEWLIDSGKVRALGSRGHTPTQLIEARILSSAGYPRLTVLDVPYNILRRGAVEGDVRLIADAQDIALTPSSPLEHGYLAGAHRTRTGLGATVRASQLVSSMNRRGARVLRVLDRIARELNVPDAAVAIGWLLSQRVVAAPIANVSAVAHVDQLVQGVGVALGRAQLADIARAAQ